MKRKIIALSLSLMILSLSFTLAGIKLGKESNVQEANINTYAAKAGTTSIGGFVSEKIDSVTNMGEIVGDISDVAGDLGNLGGGFLDGLGGSLGGIGDALGGILGGIGSDKDTTTKKSENATYKVDDYTVGAITPVPYASDNNSTNSDNANVNETVDYAATQNPYKKPTAELKGGDKGEGVKWMQWIFIYSRYGLKDDGITGVFDEDTVAIVKKLQKEKGLEVDGIADSEVIAQIELLYYEAIHGVSTTLPIFSSETVTDDLSYNGQTGVDSGEQKGPSSSVIILAVAVALIWLIAIAFVVALFLIKKKKKKKANEAKAIDTTENTEINQDNGVQE